MFTREYVDWRLALEKDELNKKHLEYLKMVHAHYRAVLDQHLTSYSRDKARMQAEIDKEKENFANKETEIEAIKSEMEEKARQETLKLTKQIRSLEAKISAQSQLITSMKITNTAAKDYAKRIRDAEEASAMAEKKLEDSRCQFASTMKELKRVSKEYEEAAETVEELRSALLSSNLARLQREETLQRVREVAAASRSAAKRSQSKAERARKVMDDLRDKFNDASNALKGMSVASCYISLTLPNTSYYMQRHPSRTFS